MPPRQLSSTYHYIRFSVSPPCPDELTLRKSIQDSLGQSFGVVSSHTYVDVLWLADDGSEMVVRIGQADSAKLMVSVTASTASPRLSLVKESPFLPALLSVGLP
ncbi:hypothetical protein A0H81_05507 [Grifola frondosa]|uniref:Uncharacterized protein n=1 Tax=Grifola frondosa TaxID=5627 RepID=A0A1C7MCE3_GRIFR|nr:hypothetical protein A0H81_05507 [Grifola frondosa]